MTPAGSLGMRNVAGAKFFEFAAPAPLMIPVERVGSSTFLGRVGVELFAVLPESTLAGGAVDSAGCRVGASRESGVREQLTALPSAIPRP